MLFAVGTARRGWVEARHVVNTLPLDAAPRPAHAEAAGQLNAWEPSPPIHRVFRTAADRQRARRGGCVRDLPRHAAAVARLRRHGRVPGRRRRARGHAAPGLSALLRHRQPRRVARRARARLRHEPRVGHLRRARLRAPRLAGRRSHRLDAGRRLHRRALRVLVHLLVAGDHRRGLRAARADAGGIARRADLVGEAARRRSRGCACSSPSTRSASAIT